ncbi:MAG: hypothetical protein ABIN01_24410 [Ferruginibacter sp.]
MKKQTLISLIIVLLFSTAAHAQTPAKSFYFELGGAGLASINYDMRFQKKEDGLGFKVGVGGFKVEGTGALFVPVGLNYLLGKDGRNYFEIGLGVTFVSITEDYYYSDDEDQFSTTFGHAFFGYRMQPKNGGFLFRAGITPVFNKDGFVPYWAGISFGYKF